MISFFLRERFFFNLFKIVNVLQSEAASAETKSRTEKGKGFFFIRTELNGFQHIVQLHDVTLMTKNVK